MNDVTAEELTEELMGSLEMYMNAGGDPHTFVHALISAADLACRKYDLYPVKPLETN